MNKSKSTFLALVAILLTPVAANADMIDVTGDWKGEWAGSGITAVFDMVLTQAADGSITGQFDWTCTSGIECFGVEEFAGTFNDVSLVIEFATTAINAPFLNLGFSSYIGMLAANGNSMSGSDSSESEWRASRVPEPGTLALLGIGLLGIGAARRRKTA